METYTPVIILLCLGYHGQAPQSVVLTTQTSCLQSGSWRSKIKLVANSCLVSPLPGLRWPSSHCAVTWRKEERLRPLLLLARAQIPLRGLHTHDVV